MSEKMLITVDQVNPLEIFVNGKYTDLLEFIRKESEIENPTVENKAGRDLIKSMAAKVASSKVFILSGGKELADAEKKKIADTLEAMNKSKKYIEDCLVYRKAEVREPLTKYEDAKKAEEAAELAKQEKIKQEAIDAEKAESDRKTKEIEDENKRLKKEADQRDAVENGKREERESANRETEQARQREVKRKDDSATSRRQMLKGIGSDHDWAILREMEESAWTQLFQERNTVYQEAQNQKFVESERLRVENEAAEKKKQDDARSADKQHRKKINLAALDPIDKILAKEPDPKLTYGQQIIIAIAKGEVPNVSIKY